ncbi:hypothetical protein [Mediterraneibacter gnavus]|uniref:hypothetical protein n=1 Tax=Mediterraneibacter gnavus TaxID=33038 RepID=UPI0011C348BC|nr:hypothetical protein [Mediterraneibacter gnavus]
MNIGARFHTPESVINLAEELTMLRKHIKDQDKKIRRLKEENKFLEEDSAFSQQTVERDFTNICQ